MASQNLTDTAASGAAAPTTLPDRTQNPADNQAGESKNAAKKAEKAAKHAAGVKTEGKKEAKKAPKKKVDGAALIGIDASKEENFPDWYQQVLTKGKNGNFNRLNFLLIYLQEICWTTMMCRAASS